MTVNLGISASQQHNAVGIIAAVKARKMSPKAAVIAIETALAESTMKMIASANVPASQHYPYERLSWSADGLGHDHASMGMFQQQTGTAWTPAGYGPNMNQTTFNSPNGWGTPAELMDAQQSTNKFLMSLARKNWEQMTNWAAAQSVQVSAVADGSNYRAFDAQAQLIVRVLWDINDIMEEVMSYYASKAAFQADLQAQIVKALATNTAQQSLGQAVWGFRATLWNKSRPTAWSVLSVLHKRASGK